MVAIAALHGLIVWWCVTNVPDGAWVMEGGNESAIASVATILLLLLNLPTIGLCFALGLPPLAFTAPGLLIGNSCLWGIASSLILKRFVTGIY